MNKKLGLQRRLPWLAAAAVALVIDAQSFGNTQGEDGELSVQEGWGRQVYIAEGCIHCHSQYVRPRVESDVLRWGPARPLSELLREQPPLPGNRRQGPDLSNVGNRRSVAWNRLHLINPQEVSPGSRMPKFAYLFEGTGGRGEALLAYLAALGRGTEIERWSRVQAWIPAANGTILPPDKTRRLYLNACAQCHGSSGHGDGLLASQLEVYPPDWPKEGWRRVNGRDEGQLARVIKFGLPGTFMAGHETLPDEAVVGLVRYLQSLQNRTLGTNSDRLQPKAQAEATHS